MGKSKATVEEVLWWLASILSFLGHRWQWCDWGPLVLRDRQEKERRSSLIHSTWDKSISVERRKSFLSDFGQEIQPETDYKSSSLKTFLSLLEYFLWSRVHNSRNQPFSCLSTSVFVWFPQIKIQLKFNLPPFTYSPLVSSGLWNECTMERIKTMVRTKKLKVMCLISVQCWKLDDQFWLNFALIWESVYP